MTPQIERQKEAIKDILKDNPADANVYVLFQSMIELVEPTRDKLMISADQTNIMVAKQINLIIDLALAVITFLDVKKANLKG